MDQILGPVYINDVTRHVIIFSDFMLSQVWKRVFCQIVEIRFGLDSLDTHKIISI